MNTSLSLNVTSLLDSNATSDIPDSDAPQVQHASPVVAFIIGLAIILLASILNAAGLNLTKLDHVRTSAIPKAQRRRDWLRPLWLLGMVLYILSQVIGSTLALEYMRAEYVAPLGSTSLIFNFLFAKFLVDSPVTNYDIYGTIIVILGVIGIVAFGSINSGLGEETSAEHLAYLWTRGNWLSFFFFMSFALIILYAFVAQLEQVLAARGDINAEPFAGMSSRRSGGPAPVGFFKKLVAGMETAMMWVREKLELWTAPQDDKRIAWTIGIGWACCGGGLAGGCLVFAKAAVKVISGSVSHQNAGNQIGRASTIFTFIFLAITAVSQIICLNRGLKVYDSTLVVPVFYGVYTAAGFLNSLIFNDEVDAYQPWTLFLIFVSMIILISGVVLLTYKKPEKKPTTAGPPGAVAMSSRTPRRGNGRKSDDDDSEQDALRAGDEPEPEEVWQIGDMSDDEDGARPHSPRPTRHRSASARSRGEGEEAGILGEEDEEGGRDSTSSDATLARTDNPPPYADDEFGGWEQGKLRE
ncbi:uncharacterized protein B0H18DRAFT_1046835 [Fomitopsis serialis]|uniref:uncharacterized protein n=1 Tax=Fomitopsis serialis TaxID=139415 RepID=UPI0020073202|nr:uncharacterized protein B0H18DRAFT_1046835 [Neoantrodia serialis]KAH9914016.1 hypothetical protein B0H18DRAFT_1046835 [Neoantrodia serialis]